MNNNIIKTLYAIAIAISVTSCTIFDKLTDGGEAGDGKTLLTPDLALCQLQGPVESVTCYTQYGEMRNGRFMAYDENSSTNFSYRLHFDREGNFDQWTVLYDNRLIEWDKLRGPGRHTDEDFTVERDSAGRITSYIDKAPFGTSTTVINWNGMQRVGESNTTTYEELDDTEPYRSTSDISYGADGMTTSKTTNVLGPYPASIYEEYGNYETDSHGNWTRRTVESVYDTFSNYCIETRKITYYQ